MEIGTHHKMNPRTLHLFFADCAWREAERHTNPIERFTKALAAVAKAGVCRTFKKYGYETKERESVKRVVSLRPVQRVQAAALESMRAVMGGLDKLADTVAEFLTQTSVPPTFAASGYAKAAETLLWTLGRRKKGPAAPVAPAPAVTFNLPPPTVVVNYSVSGLLPHRLTT